MITITLSDRINALAESETLAMTRKSRELKAQGHDVINLSIGEPDFNTPDFIKEAAKAALDDNFTHYSPVSGYQELREAICHKLKRDNGLEYKPNQVVVSTGAKQSIANAMMVMLNKGDEVIIPTPYWVSYKEIVKLSEASPVFIHTNLETDYKITAQQLEDAITPKSRILIFSSPCNPSGSVYTAEELHALARVLEKHPRIFIISDEIYELINFIGKHHSIASFEFIKDRVILINGVSKGFAMTGWRLGFMAADAMIAQACDKLQGQVTSGTCSISQRASIAAMMADPATCKDIIEMKAAFQSRRDLILSLLGHIPGLRVNVPLGAFYVFADASAYFNKTDGERVIADSETLCDYLLCIAHVALVPGSAFGNPNCIRLSYAASAETLVKAMDRISAALNNLK